jgi:hypothetical protein
MSAIFAKKKGSSSGGQVTANLADVFTASVGLNYQFH